MANQPEFTVVESVPFSEIAFIDNAIFEFNVSVVKDRKFTWVHVLCTDAGGARTGALDGVYRWGWFTLETLWVTEGNRGRGIGGALLSWAESKAVTHGCYSARAELFAWEDLRFFRNRAYRVEATLPDFPSGHSRLFLVKQLGVCEPRVPAGHTVAPVGDGKDTTFAANARNDQAVRVVGSSPKHGINIALRQGDGTVVGGIFGHCQHGWFEADVLYLNEPARRRGYGTQLLRRAEAQAVKLGARNAYLGTFEWQARGFYEKQGYEVFIVYRDHPRGYCNYGLWKSLIPSPA